MDRVPEQRLDAQRTARTQAAQDIVIHDQGMLCCQCGGDGAEQRKIEIIYKSFFAIPINELRQSYLVI